MTSHTADLASLQRRINVMGETVTGNSDSVDDINEEITKINEDIQRISSATTGQIESLIASPTDMQCRALAGGSNDDIAAILPGGRSFTLCQPESA